MNHRNRYPKLNIGSKNELAKQISSKSFSFQSSLKLINDILQNFDNYWHDSKSSQPEKGKYVRSAIGTPLDKLLKLIDRKVLIPYDYLVPSFIFGGVTNKNHIQAAYALLGKQKKRRLLGLDISTFFEQIKKERVFYFFYKKCNCSARVSRLLARLCCVPAGKKGDGSKDIVLARGFSTSSRLAVWTNLDTFLRLKWMVGRDLKNHDPRIVVFVDDIGISASRVTHETFDSLKLKIKKLLLCFDKNQELPINENKSKNRSFARGVEHLGMHLGRNKITFGYKTKAKKEKIKNELQQSSGIIKKALIKKIKSYHSYQQQINRVLQTNNN